MICLNCGTTLTKRDYCAVCGAQMKTYKKIEKLSNFYYNKGLEKANARNLSGAIEDLQYSLLLNKNNYMARNLLGLVYFEIGELVEALSQWIISKNLKEKDNIADEYIQKVQSNQNKLEALNQTMKKYNQALLYCQQESQDLAIIQLKKVLSMNPNFVRAHQLLALTYIQTGEVERAGREIDRILKINKTDEMALQYKKELNLDKEQKPETKQEKKGQDIISYTSGNETIIMPKTTYKESTGVNVVINIVIGIVVGLALMWFLVVPAKVQQIRTETNQQIREYGDQISSLQLALDTESEKEPEKETVVEEEEIHYYEMLVDAYNTYILGDYVKTAEALKEIDLEQLSESGKVLYNEMYAVANAEAIQIAYNEGYAAYQSQNYEEVVTKLDSIVSVTPEFNNGYALYYLARSYEKLAKYEEAKPLMKQFVERYPNTERGLYCQNALLRME